MADSEQDRAEDAGTDEAAEAAFEQGFAALSGADEEADETEATETEAEGDAPESAADDAEETPTPPTAEELGYDLKNPKDKAAYEAMVKKWGVWTNRFHAKQKAKPEPPAEKPPQQPAETPQGEAWDPYTVRRENYSFKSEPEPEGSELAGFEEAIDRRADARAWAIVDHVMAEMRLNDARLRQQQQEMTVAEKLNAFGNAIKDHPELESLKPQIVEFINDTQEVAKKNPERWMKMFKAEFGFGADWRDGTPSQPQRPTKRPIASVPRPTNGNRVASAPAASNDMDLNDAFEHNWRRMKGL